jgi:hypothetical protein
VITRGWADPQNHAKSLQKGEPLVPGTFYDVTFDLQPDDQILPARRALGLMIFASDRDFTLWPRSGARADGRPRAVAILLFQDLAVIPLLLLVPMLGEDGGTGLGGLALVMGKAVLAVAVVLFVARFGFSRAAAVVVRTGGRELFTLFTVMLALGAAWATLQLHCRSRSARSSRASSSRSPSTATRSSTRSCRSATCSTRCSSFRWGCSSTCGC